MSKQNEEININFVKEDNNIDEKNKKNPKRRRKLFVLTFLSACLLIFATYAWFSATLNVKIKFFNMAVASDDGLFISLDGIDFDNEITVTVDSILKDLTPRYPNHVNRWALSGLWTVSSNGIPNNNSDKFAMFEGQVVRRRPRDRTDTTIRRFLNTIPIPEEYPTAAGTFIAFDFFLKNVSPSPYADNLYFNEDTYIDFAENTTGERKEELMGVRNSLRFGIVKIGSVPMDTDVRGIQNIQCNNRCESVIYEPFHTEHSLGSIADAMSHGIYLIDGVPAPTYAVIREGYRLEHKNGHFGTGIPLDRDHFAPQETITNFATPIFEIPPGITKLRAYFWIEGQDVDSLEADSKGAMLEVFIGLIKDLASYEYDD